MYEWIDSLRFSVCLLFLSVASIYDIKTREVPNFIWLLFAPIGTILTFISLALNNWNLSLIKLCGLSIIVVVGLSFILFYLGLFGGADAKALICLAFSMPVYPNLGIIGLPLKLYPLTFLILPPLSTFNNAVLMASLLIFIITLKNLIDLMRNGMKIFEGLEGEKITTKILAFITGFRVEAHKLRTKKHHYIVLEEFSREKDGSIRRKLKVFQRISDEKGENIPEEINGKIWVTVGLPFLVFITIGFTLAIFMGDLIFWLLNTII